MRKGRIDYAYYAKRAGGSAVARASPASVWALVAAIGGDNRYYYPNAGDHGLCPGRMRAQPWPASSD